MKIIFKITLCISIVLLTFHTKAQFTYGLKGGVNGNNVKIEVKNNTELLEPKMRLGLHIGAVLNFEINANFNLQSGITLNNKGYSYNITSLNANGESVEGKYVATYNYIQVPVNFIFNLKNGLQAYAGPYIGFGTGGREKYSATVKTDSSTYKIGNEYNLKPVIGDAENKYLTDNEEPYNGFAYGFNFALGYKKGQTSINLEYSMGMTDVLPNNSNRDYKIYNKTLSLSLTYLILKKD